MPQPAQSEVHVDSVLTNISVAYIQKKSNFIAQTVFPVVPVEKQSDVYFIYNKSDWFRDEAEFRADATESAGSGYTVTKDNYYCPVTAFHKDVGDQVRKNTDNPLNPDRDATTFVTQRLMLRQEIQWAADYFKTGVWATDVVGGTNFTKWGDFGASDPLEDIETGKEQIIQTTGFEANTLVLGYHVFRKLKNHPDLVDRIKYTSSEAVSTAIMAKYFDVDRILVCKAIKNTGAEGANAQTYGFVHSSSAFLSHVASSPSLQTPTAGYVFQWKGISDGLGTSIGIQRFRMQQLRADRIEGQIAWTNKVVAADMGYFFSQAA